MNKTTWKRCEPIVLNAEGLKLFAHADLVREFVYEIGCQIKLFENL